MSSVPRFAEAVVEAVLSGDSIVIRFVDPPLRRFAVTIFALQAPRFGSPDGSITDEPHAWDSWNFLRELSLGKRVTLSRDLISNRPTVRHLAFPDAIPGTVARVQIINGGDLARASIVSGWGRFFRPRAASSTSRCLKELSDASDEAEQRGIGA
jgi:hypothetical protein